MSIARCYTKEEQLNELMEDGYPEDLTGLKFGKLEIVYKCELPKRNSYHCKCECGNECDHTRSYLISGHNVTCGKCSRDLTVSGDSRTRIYSSYRHMLDRCYNPNNTEYYNYGGRGITVCDRWRECYGNFKEDMYEEFIAHAAIHGENDTTLDRRDPDGNYCPENCRWLTNAEQQRNRRNNRIVTLNGLTGTLVEHIENGNVKDSTVRSRICRGMSPEEALTKDVHTPDKLFYKGIPLAEYCRKNDIDYKLVVSRICDGWDIESAVEAPIYVRYKEWLDEKRSVIGPHLLYKGIFIWKYCKENSLSYETVRQRIYHGWDVDSAIEAPIGVSYNDWLCMTGRANKAKSKYWYGGYPLKYYCKINGIPYKRVENRLYAGWDIEDAINAPKGTQYKTWLKMKENNKNSLDNNE